MSLRVGTLVRLQTARDIYGVEIAISISFAFKTITREDL